MAAAPAGGGSAGNSALAVHGSASPGPDTATAMPHPGAQPIR